MAKLSQLERRLEVLEEENHALKTSIQEWKSLYEELIHGDESVDHRRVNLLKSQLIQNRKQVLLLNEAVGSRVAVQLEVENALHHITQIVSDCLNTSGKIGEVTVSREALRDILQSCESARIKLCKNIENTSAARLHRPVYMMSPFIKDEPLTVLDLCLGSTHHIELKQVAVLESQLAELYTKLTQLQASLSTVAPPSGESPTVTPHLPAVLWARLFRECSALSSQLDTLLQDLLELSVLVPAAPWATLSRPIIKELTVANVMGQLTWIPQRRKEDVRDVVGGILKVLSLNQLKASTMEKSLKDELNFHQAIYQLQTEYLHDVFIALRDGFIEFHKDLANAICEPLKEILRIYQVVKRTAAEEAIVKFLAKFKQCEPQLSSTVDRLQTNTRENQGEYLSVFGRQFFDKLKSLQDECERTRDRNLAQLKEVKDMYKEHLAEMKQNLQTHATKSGAVHKVHNVHTAHSDGEDETMYNKGSVSQMSTSRSVHELGTSHTMSTPGAPQAASTPAVTFTQAEANAVFYASLRGDGDSGTGFDTSVSPPQSPGPGLQPVKKTKRLMKGVAPGKLMLQRSNTGGFNRTRPVPNIEQGGESNAKGTSKM